MGNEASRAAGDGLSPHALSPGASPGVPASPRTPASVRRTKSFSSTNGGDHVDRTIQRMDKTIRKRVRGGITYNMKIILRGDKGTGKTSLFQRLKGEPIPSTHEPTPQLQSATINWNFRANSEESVKCDVWDVVDKGFHPASEATNGDENPFEAQAVNGTTGAHMVATVDATTVDVYHETHGVVFLLDVTKPHTLEYVRQQLDQVPVHIPTLVLGNFRDLGSQRKIFKEDIQELLYGGSATQHQPLRRPHELLYFECSLLNCYGLKSLHQYFGIPFLQLKQQTIRQQLRILEGEFTHLKHDLQAKIAEQKYADYLEHIKATGSDIRTGRRAAATAASSTPSNPKERSLSNGEKTLEVESPTPKTRLDRTLSSSSDIVVHSDSAPASLQPPESSAPPSQPQIQQVDLEDLPERTAALAQAGNTLKIDYTEEERRATRKPIAMPPLPGTLAPPTTVEDEPGPADTADRKKPTKRAQFEEKPSAVPTPPPSNDAPMTTLEDFQVPKPRHNDLDSFYSDESSEEDVGNDDDVVISAAGARMASMKYHKQVFLDSDDSDSEVEKKQAHQSKARADVSSKRRSPRRQVTKPSTDVPATSTASNSISPSPPSPVRPSSPSRSAPSPPRPTTSPSHSPRRRVRDSEAVVSPDQNMLSSEPSTSSIGASETISEMPPLPFTHLLQKSSTHSFDAGQSIGNIAATTIDKPTSETPEEVPESAVGGQTEIAGVNTSANEEMAAPVLDTPKDVAASVKATENTTHEVSVATAEEVTSVTSEVSDHTPASPAVEPAEEAEDLVVPTTESFFVEGEEDEEEIKLHSHEVPLEHSVTSEIVVAQVNHSSDEAAVSVTKSSVTITECAEAVESTEAMEVQLPVSSGAVSQLEQQRHGIELSLTDDDSDENGSITPPRPATKPPANRQSMRTQGRKVEMIMSDDDSDDGVPMPPPRAKTTGADALQSATYLSSFSSPPMAPAAPSGSASLGDILEAFLNDSASDSDNSPPKNLGSRTTAKPAAIDDDSDEDSGNDRFAAYDKKRSSEKRKGTSRRKRDDFFTTTIIEEHGLSGSSSRTSSFSTVGESSSIQTQSIANSDVLAAIRQAEEDARRMLEASTPIATPRRVNHVSEDVDEGKKKKKKSSSSSSSRRKKDLGDGDDGERKKSKKKKDKDSSSSRSSKRREIILTDEDE